MADQDKISEIDDLENEITGNTASKSDETKHEIPEKFQGKSPEEIVQMYGELEKDHSRLGNEVGDLRKMVISNDLLEASITDDSGSDGDIDPDEYFNDPVGYTEKIVQKQMKPIENMLAEQTAKTGLDKLTQDHPDYVEVSETPEFHSYVASSPYRTKMFNAAMKADFEAAGDLLAMFKEHKEYQKAETQAAVDETKAERQEALRKGTLESGSTNDSVGKVYRRSDLIDLKRNDPQKYNDLMPEIMLAYSEGRVK